MAATASRTFMRLPPHVHDGTLPPLPERRRSESAQVVSVLSLASPTKCRVSRWSQRYLSALGHRIKLPAGLTPSRYVTEATWQLMRLWSWARTIVLSFVV